MDSVVIDDHESSDKVIEALKQALAPGVQAITDQGTPYMAAATVDALNDLDVEHAPQEEGDPTGKATLERAFRSLKTIAGPLFSLSNRCAAAWPALRRPELAKAASRLVVAVVLKAYQAGARATRRATEARGSLDPVTLAHLGQHSRELARAETHSRRLFLQQLHDDYHLPESGSSFVRAFSKYPLRVLQQADQGFRTQAHRDIRSPRRYFAAIVRNEMDAFLLRRKRERHHLDLRAQLVTDHRERVALFHVWDRDPIQWLRAAFGFLAAWWVPSEQVLACEGHGPGRGALIGALARMVELFGAPSAAHSAMGAFHAYAQANPDKLPPNALDQILKLLLAELPAPNASAILAPAGLLRRPPPQPALRN